MEKSAMHPDIKTYNEKQSELDRLICEKLAEVIYKQLPQADSKVWHAHPVWFLEDNPIVGYSKLKNSVRLLFWSGRSFGESGLQDEGSFMAAEKRYEALDDIVEDDLIKWLDQAKKIQWDYKNLAKRKGTLVRLK